MGCDIHFFIEVKTENGWELYSRPQIKRDYNLFAKLADVRNEERDIKPLSLPKGLPDNISYLVKKSYESWEIDAHNQSYLTGREIIALSKWVNETYDGVPVCLEHTILNNYLEGNTFAGFYTYPDERPSWIEDVRFVFWFDN